MISRGDDQLLRLAFGDAARLLAADRADQLLELADAGFARVVAHDVADRTPPGTRSVVRLNAVLLDLPRDQVAEGDVRSSPPPCNPAGR